jgi:steroid delta-isomerase-like uncharacterized protein
MHMLYANQVQDAQLSADQQRVLRSLRAIQPIGMSNGVDSAGTTGLRRNFNTAQDWVTAFFTKGAEEVLGYYADDFVWEDIEFYQTITTKEELYKAFIVFNDSGPESAFGIHKFEVLTYDGGPAGSSGCVTRQGDMPSDFPADEYHRLGDKIFLGANLDYDEWGYMQWIWKATHNEDFMGMPAKGKTTYTRGTTTQMYREGKIVRCRTHWNFREFAVQLGLLPAPDDNWRKNPGLETKA